MALGRLAEGNALHAQHQGADANEQTGDEQNGEHGLPGKRRCDDQELAHENAEGRHAGDRDHPQYEAPAEQRWLSVRPRISAIFCVP